MPPLRRPGAAHAASEADFPPVRPVAESNAAAAAALLQSPSGYHVAFPDTRPPSPLDDLSAYASKQLRRCVAGKRGMGWSTWRARGRGGGGLGGPPWARGGRPRWSGDRRGKIARGGGGVRASPS